jgi:prepilin-type N-terminal cleavage/methylation domain-containing protein
MARGKRSDGFTVLEVAVSLAIAGIALVVLLQLLSTSLIVAGRADRLVDATMLARSELLETVAGEPVSLGRRSGTGLSGLQWETDVSTASDGTEGRVGERSLVSIVVKVRASGQAIGDPLVQVSSLALMATQ